MDDPLVRVAQLGADGGPQAKAHGAESAGGQQLAGIAEVEVLDGPHLVLAHLCYDNRIPLFCLPVNLLHNAGACEGFSVIFQRIFVFQFRHLGNPGIMIVILNARIQPF